jgi:hypothetical protein
MKRSLIFITIFMFIMVQAAFAQWGKGQGPKMRGTFNPVVGAWAEYKVTGGKEPPTKMKVSIVGKEGSSYWYETVTEIQGIPTVMKMLVSGDPDDKSATRMITKRGKERAVEMPMGNEERPKDKKPEPKGGKVVDKGMESITVPAGTLRAQHMQYQEGKDVTDTWISDKVPPYCIVKSHSKNMDMILTGYGMGAKTLITETPKKFEMPKMPAGMPRGMKPPGMGAPGKD